MSKNQRINQIEPSLTKKDADSVYKYLTSGGWVTEHAVTRNFENLIKDYVNRKYGIAVPNGTIAIYLALLAADIGKGDKVAVPNITMIATVNAVLWAGATPVLVDVENNFTMSVEKLSSIKNLKAAIYVPLNGRTANGLEIQSYCKSNKITLIEDSAHALGSEYSNKQKCGSLGDISIFSFTPHKIITTGQGGMIVTNNKKFASNLNKIKTFNRRRDKLDWHEGFGLNFKFTDLQASLGISQMYTLEERIIAKNKILNKYKKINSNFFKLGEYDENELPWFFEIISTSKRDLKSLQTFLLTLNIETRYSYPALSKQKYLKDIPTTNLSYSEKVHDKILWLPSSTTLKNKDISLITNAINSFERNANYG